MGFKPTNNTVVRPGRYNRITVQLPDNSSARAEVGDDGKLYLLDAAGQRIPEGQAASNSGATSTQNRPGQPQSQPQPTPGEGAGGTGTGKDRQGRDLPDIPKDATFKARLESILKDNSYDRMLKGRTRGRLNMSALYKAQLQQRTVFKHKAMRRSKKYNIVLLVDESGSMGGYKMFYAAGVAGFLAHNFQELDINLGVVGFSSGAKVRKRFDQDMPAHVLQDTMINDMQGGGTEDIAGLTEAYKMLLNRDGENLVIVLTDGEVGNLGRTQAFVHKHDKLTSTFGIGILTPACNIPKNVMANNLDELKPLVLNIIKSSIKRG